MTGTIPDYEKESIEEQYKVKHIVQDNHRGEHHLDPESRAVVMLLVIQLVVMEKVDGRGQEDNEKHQKTEQTGQETLPDSSSKWLQHDGLPHSRSRRPIPGIKVTQYLFPAIPVATNDLSLRPKLLRP
jgi:hypothetical protein